MKILNSNWKRFAVTIIISLIILIFLFSKIDGQEVLSAIYSSDLRLVLLAVFISLSINIFLGVFKWRRILAALDCPLSYTEALSIRTGCIPFKVIFPIKSSELLKALCLNKQKKLGFGHTVSSLLLDKTLNLLVTLGIFLVGLSFVELKFPRIIPVSALLIIIVFLFSAKLRGIFLSISKAIHPRLHHLATQLFTSFEVINVKEKIILTFYSIIYQFSDFLNTYILFRAVGVSVPLISILALLPLIILVNNLPITVLGLGTREALIIFLFARYGSSTSLLSGGILVSFIEHILPVVVGIFFIKSFLSHFALKDASLSFK